MILHSAYRFPTDDCPGYYGFAFPSGANRTQAQLSQKPTSTPASSSQCLSLNKPTSTPTSPEYPANIAISKDIYDVYGRPGSKQVPLKGINDLPKGVWGRSQ